MPGGYTINWRYLLGTGVGLGLVALVIIGLSRCSAGGDHFSLGPGVTPSEQREIRDGYRAMQDWLNSGGREVEFGSFEVFAEADVDALIREYAYQVEDDAEGMAGLRNVLLGGGAFAIGPYAFIYTGPRWREAPGTARTQIVAHEVFHLLQYGLIRSGQRFGDRPLGGLPDWLAEGSADWASARATDAKGILSYASLLRDARAESQTTGARLVDLEDASPVHSPGDSSPYALGFAAVDLLSEAKGETSVLAFWEAVGSTGDWRSAFAATFGETPEDFYTRFEMVRAQEFPANAGGVEGVIRSGEGPVWAAAITACRQAGCYRAISGRDGRFRLALPDGEYQLPVEAPSSGNLEMAQLPVAVRRVTIAGRFVSGITATAR